MTTYLAQSFQTLFPEVWGQTTQYLIVGMRKLESKSAGLLRNERGGEHLICCVDKGLSIVPTEIINHLDLITIREDGLDQGCALVCAEGAGDQTVPR